MVDTKAPPPGYVPPKQPAPPPAAPRHEAGKVTPNSPTQRQDNPDRSADRPSQRDIDIQRKHGAAPSKNWYRDEGSVVGEDPASIDFLGGYPWPNVGEPGENRDDDTPITPPAWRAEDEQETIAEEQRRKSEMDARASRKVADRRDDDPLEKEYPSSPASAFRTQREKDTESARAGGRTDSAHSLNQPTATNRPHSPA